jgi:hypothetical protein
VRENTQRPIVVPQEGFIYTEVVSGSQRALPSVILDRAAGVDFPADQLEDGIGVLSIRSVYDIDGVDTAPGGIAGVRNPATTSYATRPARFLRIEKAVSIPDDDTRDFSNTAFGPNRALGMREILGYAPVEPDGSVKVKIPANVAFAISVLDANGRRLGGPLGGRHTNWLQLQPGEQLTCNGCHDGSPTNTVAHGRKGMTNSVNPGAPTSGSAFPNTNPAIFADAGETMAEARARVMCGGACELSVDLAFKDYWVTTPTTTNQVDACYATGPNNVLTDPADPTIKFSCSTRTLTTAVPLLPSASCRATPTNLCRITIHYERHIHPLWGVDRMGTDPATGLPVNNKCNSCHTNAVATEVPSGDLDLSDGPSEAEPLHFKSYRELLFGDNGQIFDGTQVVDECLERDPVTMVCTTFRTVPAPMSANGANASARFFDKMQSTGGTVNHSDFMSPSELRLLSEWLDIGAQYFNDPFTAPEN